ncbi:MAG: Co2+/Mg2+ efflux protein ApaG [Gammaproteobacteria bacterium]|nr:Co2+/Mg2+ efflux protein ApaG [Gammaproteobacteria bacterium]
MQKKPFPITIKAESKYLPEQSDIANQKFIWSYEINILNESDEIVQLLNRHWLITDMTSRIEEVNGAGVVGLQPLIKPGKRFVYTSFCQLLTPQGTMEGFYEMQNLDEKHFKIEIPKFILSAPSGITKKFRDKLH